MRTRIILHGGNSSKKSEKNDRFFQEVINGVESDIVNVLCVYFARPERRWKESHEEDQRSFTNVQADKHVQTTLATYEGFVDEVSKSDVIFMNGGISGHLKPILLVVGIERFRQILAGKTLVGVSAGANVLSKYYFSTVAHEIREGAGFLGLKVMTHYSPDQTEELEQLKAYGDDLPVVKIAEEEYLVIE